VASDTKAPSGHSDILMGHVASRDEQIMERIEQWRRLSGSIPGPHEAWLLHRSLETLGMRFGQMCSSADVIAERLSQAMPGKVVYPGLAGHPERALATKQMARNGFLIGVTFKNKDVAEDFINNCSMLRPVTSFGGTHSSAERRARWGDDVADGFVRISIGCEPVEELWGAFELALSQ
jgi:cystathionine gamma-lyase